MNSASWKASRAISNSKQNTAEQSLCLAGVDRRREELGALSGMRRTGWLERRPISITEMRRENCASDRQNGGDLHLSLHCLIRMKGGTWLYALMTI